MNQFTGIAIPLLLHLCTTEIVAAVFGGKLDAAARTLLVALLVLPWAAWMYRKDSEKSRTEKSAESCKEKSEKLCREKSGKSCTEKSAEFCEGKSEKLCREKSGKSCTEKSAEFCKGKRTGRKTALGTENQKRLLRCGFCFLAGGILNIAWSGLMNLLQIRQHFSNTAQEALLAGQFAVQLLAMGFLVPLTEELVFRGLIYRRMRRVLPYLQSVILASALFAVYHGNVIQMVFAFPMAVVICVLYEKWELFRYPFLFHLGCNLTAIVVNYAKI